MKPCPLCGGPSPEALRTFDRNRAVSEERFQYRRCRDCRCYWLEDPPPDLGRYYPADYNPRPSPAELRVQAAHEAHRMALAARWVRGGRLVEIGPGSGAFAAAATEAGFDVTVIDRDRGAGEHLARVLGVRAIESDAPERSLAALPPSRVVAMWHVLEHLADPWATLRAAAENLEPSGLLMLATPNPDAIGLRLARARWAHVDAPRHLFLLAARELVARAAAEGLRLLAITTADPVGQALNEHAWRYALVSPRLATRAPASRAAALAGHVLAVALGPLERRALRGAAYTVVLRKAR